MNLPRGPQITAHRARWPGFDWDFFAEVRETYREDEIQEALRALGEHHTFSGLKPTPFAPPVAINRVDGERLARFCSTYHRMIETIVARYQGDARLRRTVPLPPEIAADALRDQAAVANAVTLCRIDFYLHASGGFSVLETNANCPGLLVYSGIGARQWREWRDGDAPEALPYEDPAWFADWYLAAAAAQTGAAPEALAIICQENGYRLELDEIGDAFRSRGIAILEVDPRQIRRTCGNAVQAGSRTFSHGYLKLSIPEFCTMRGQLAPFLDAVGAGDLFVQNGLLGRWVGDNKLCLAAISDPALADLFHPDDRAMVEPHVPWSRNVALCSPEELAEICARPEDYVLKRPLDTRGRGVIVGRVVESRSEWEREVDNAVRNSWLVMAYVEPTYIESDTSAGSLTRHDLALGLINGEVAAGFVRSSTDVCVNVARSGRLHPLFLAR